MTAPHEPVVFPGVQVNEGDPRYATLVRGFNLRWVGQPKYVQVCGSAAQVVQQVQRALDQGLRITVRGGGHCYEDFVSGNVGGAIIDLTPMRGVSRLGSGDYVVEAGATLWDVYWRLYREYGVTLPGGSCYSVGAGGHITGGGYGLLSRLHGLTVDHLSAVELVHVTRDRKAELVTVRKDSPSQDERDLFWANQGGGGGNFGIVTRFFFADLPRAPSQVLLLNYAWNWSDLTQAQLTGLVKDYGEFFAAHRQPGDPYDGLFALFHLTQKAASQLVLTAQLAGDDRAPLDELARHVTRNGRQAVPQVVPVGYHHWVARSTDVRQLEWLFATQLLNGSGPNQRGKYKSAYLIEPFPERQIEVIWRFLTDPGYSNPQALLQVDSYGGRINAVPPDATAVPQRSSILKLQYQTYWVRPEDDAVNLRWIRDFYTAMYGERGPYPDGTVDGCYVNYPDSDLRDWQFLYYKHGYPRLQRTKLRWDPHDVFNHRQSIQLP